MKKVKFMFKFQFFYLTLLICILDHYSLSCQNNLMHIERDKYIDFGELLNSSSVNNLDIYLKFTPPTPINGCYTINYISMAISGNLSYDPSFLTFDIYFKDCSNELYYKTISIPLSVNEFTSYTKKDYLSDSNYLLGSDTNNFYNNDYKFASSEIESISNIRVTSSYNARGPLKAVQFENPSRINISNEPGEENTKSDRAELNSNVSLSFSGGRLPSAGIWTWYVNNDIKQQIGTGTSITYNLDAREPEILVSVVGSTTDGKYKTEPVSRKIYFEVKQVLLKDIDLLVASKLYDQAFELAEKLKKSYTTDTEINNKYYNITQLMEIKKKQEEDAKLNEIVSKEYDLFFEFPNESKIIKYEFKKLVNSKVFSNELSDGNYVIDIGLKYLKEDKYYFKSNINSSSLNNNINSYFVDNLNKAQIYYNPPTFYVQNRLVEVNAFGRLLYKFDIVSSKEKIIKNNGIWLTKNFKLQSMLNKNYFNLADGKYSFDIRTVTFGGVDYFFTSGKVLQTKGGPTNVFKSAIIPSLGRNSVGLKKGALINIAIIGLAALSVGSKLYSNKEYNKFLQANDQFTLNKAYNNANLSNQIFLVSTGLGLTIYSTNLISVFSKGLKNRAKNKNIVIVPSKDDIVIY